MGKVQDNY